MDDDEECLEAPLLDLRRIEPSFSTSAFTIIDSPSFNSLGDSSVNGDGGSVLECFKLLFKAELITSITTFPDL